MKKRYLFILLAVLLVAASLIALYQGGVLFKPQQTPSAQTTAPVATPVASPDAGQISDSLSSGQTEYSKYSGTFFGTFDTVVTLIGYAPSEDDFNRELAAVEALFQHYHQIFDNYHAYDGVANIFALNKSAAQAPVKVDDDLFDLLVWCKSNQEKYGSDTVNIAMGTLLSIWHDYREDAELDPTSAAIPPMTKLTPAANHMNIEDVILDAQNKTVYYSDPNLMLDLGAVAKGYTAEKAAQYLLSSTMPSFIISAGGNVRAGQKPLDGRERWGVGVQDPDGSTMSSGDLMDTLYLKNLSVVTSGDYQRYYVVDGVRYHHLISPITLMPADYFRAVTIVTEDSAWADYLSTMVFLLPYEQGRAFVDSLDGVEALWVMNDRTVLMTDGMKAMAKSQGASSK